jgi:hypothetical protein
MICKHRDLTASNKGVKQLPVYFPCTEMQTKNLWNNRLPVGSGHKYFIDLPTEPINTGLSEVEELRVLGSHLFIF